VVSSLNWGGGIYFFSLGAVKISLGVNMREAKIYIKNVKKQKKNILSRGVSTLNWGYMVYTPRR